MGTGYDPAVWDGDRPLVEPFDPTPFGPGDIVSCREPIDPDGYPTIRGIIVHVTADEDGEAWVTMAREENRRGLRRAAGVPGFAYRAYRVSASELNREDVIRCTPHDRAPAWRYAARIAHSVAYDHIGSSKAWTGEELYLLGAAQELASLPYGREAE